MQDTADHVHTAATRPTDAPSLTRTESIVILAVLVAVSVVLSLSGVVPTPCPPGETVAACAAPATTMPLRDVHPSSLHTVDPDGRWAVGAHRVDAASKAMLDRSTRR
jgi:hypothetical protein